ncbi:MAG: sugar phosphate isomerase/epimerase [bacterium]
MQEHGEKKGSDRRTFLKQLAAVGVSTSVLSACSRMSSHSGDPSTATLVGLQLYTVRDLLEKDFEGTLGKIAQIGYTNMEFAGYYNHTPEQVRAILDRLRMVSKSAHIGAQLMRQDAATQIRSAQVIGQEYITIPSYNFPRDGGIDAWKKGAAEFNQWGALCKNAGLRLAYHNHNAEFAKVDGGPTGIDVLLRETDPALVDFEMDLYWTAFADQDPLVWFKKYPGRFAMWHTKDLLITGGNKGMAPVGKGTLDFKAFFAHARESGMKYFFVEHDSAATYPGGSLASVEASYTYLHGLVG